MQETLYQSRNHFMKNSEEKRRKSTFKVYIVAVMLREELFHQNFSN